MREIKFDAIYTPTGEHFEPYKIDFRDNTTFGNFGGVQNDWCHFSFDGDKGDAILRQFTGLLDKNENPIYEGDILSTDLTRPYLIVRFRNGAFMYECRDSGVDFFDFMTPVDETEIIQKYHEILGNVFEHKHLLEEA